VTQSPESYTLNPKPFPAVVLTVGQEVTQSPESYTLNPEPGIAFQPKFWARDVTQWRRGDLRPRTKLLFLPPKTLNEVPYPGASPNPQSCIAEVADAHA
jgi:hypothetical protein